MKFKERIVSTLNTSHKHDKRKQNTPLPPPREKNKIKSLCRKQSAGQENMFSSGISERILISHEKDLTGVNEC